MAKKNKIKKVTTPKALTATQEEDIIQKILDLAGDREQVPISRGFEIPTNFLKQLNEFTNGGFLLFTFDTNGSPRIYQSFDTDKDNLSMHRFISHYADCMENLHANITMGKIVGESDDDGEGLGKNT